MTLNSNAKRPQSTRRAFLKLSGAAAVVPAGWRARAGPSSQATLPGEVSSPYPTLTSLAIEWKIEGDENLNGVVDVAYRAEGESLWHSAMPLRRIPAGSSTGTRPIFHWENRHSGSIFDLRPNTWYEIHLRLTDPDGGSAEKSIRARTRPFPRAAPNGRIRETTPQTLAEVSARALPGDVLLLDPGYYGAFTALRDGEPDRPIVIRSRTMELFEDLGRGGSVPAGSAVFDRVSLQNRKYVHLENVTVNGSVDLLGGEELAVRRCLIQALYGIIARRPPGAKNCYIADNIVTGIMPWENLRMGSRTAQDEAANRGMGIEITGPGNVICHNRVTGYRDCITLMEDQYAHEQVCIDIYNNDIYRGLDDGVEADFSMGNVRVMRNRLTNCFMGLSSQPSLGGPTYFIRNVMYNITCSPFKLSRRTFGDLLLHNTVVKVGDGYRTAGGGGIGGYLYSRNNLCLGGEGGGNFGIYDSGPGLAFSIHLPSESDDLDYDGVGTHGLPFRGRVGGLFFESLEEMRNLTTEKHAVQIDLNVFEQVEFPNPATLERQPADLCLRAGSAAVDAGVPIPNINDNYRGTAPDLGAHELGEELPIYGPRPEGVNEETLQY